MQLSQLGRKYPWRPARPSLTRKLLTVHCYREDALPTEGDLTSTFPKNYDQLDVGSCVDNTVAGIVQHLMMITNYKHQFVPSRNFLYWNARGYEGTQNSDSGSTVADGIRALREFGVCPEFELDGTNPDWIWAYGNAASGLYLKKPNPQCFADAVLHASLSDAEVDLNRAQILNLLAQGYPIAFGFTVHQSFESDETMKTGVMKIPGFLFDPSIGGHCITAVGYALNKPMGHQGVKDWLLIRNSWGSNVYPDMGKLAGHFWMPLDQVACNPKIASDAHIISTVGRRAS